MTELVRQVCRDHAPQVTLYVNDFERACSARLMPASGFRQVGELTTILFLKRAAAACAAPALPPVPQSVNSPLVNHLGQKWFIGGLFPDGPSATNRRGLASADTLRR